MKKIFEWIKKNYFINNDLLLPLEGSVYTHNKKGSAYNGLTGIVKHHNDGKAFMIECETCCLCNIKP
jgi:hypothetical protein